MKVSSSWLAALVVIGGVALAEEQSPTTMTYKTAGPTALQAQVFGMSAGAKARSTIVLFHGGGWTIGAPEWVYADARRYADMGAVAIAVQYRLSNVESGITPVDAMDDACDVMRWVRANAGKLGVDTSHVAAYGVSAGGHLAASLVFHCGPGVAPDALLLISPAVAMGRDAYFQSLLGQRGNARQFSPDEHLAGRLPPTIIFNGTLDNLTPLAGVKRYCNHARAAGGDCRLHEYPGTGHLFTRKQPFDTATFDPDPAAWEDVVRKGNAFLAEHGFLPARPAPQ